MPSSKKEKQKNIIIFYISKTTFVDRDIQMLKHTHNISTFHFKVIPKIKHISSYFYQFIFILNRIRSTDLFIVWFSGHQGVLPGLFGKLFNIPTVIMVGGTDAAHFPDIHYGNSTKPFLKAATWVAYKFCNIICPVHEKLAEEEYCYYRNAPRKQGYLNLYSSTKNKTTVTVPSGFDTEFFKPKPGTKRNKNSFLTVGNLSIPDVFFRKGIDLVIILAQKFADYDFTIVGAPLDYIFTNCPANLKILPSLSPQQLIDIYSSHQFYLQLSISEGLPNALCEAMLCGCIPIGSNVTGIPDIIGDTGFILKEKNTEELYALIKYVCEKDSTEYERLSNSARERAVNNYSSQIRRNGLASLINNIGNENINL